MSNQLIPVSFRGDSLALIDHKGEPYVAMKPVVRGMGLDWKSQHAKLKANAERWGMVMITMPSLGGAQETMSLPLRKLVGWMTTIQPSRVRPEIKDKIIAYQNECDDALWQYWSAGRAVNPRSQHSPANDSAVEFAKLALQHLPNLGNNSKQALLSHISELAYGQRLIPLPKVEEHLMPAGEVGEKLGITGAMVGRLANANCLKVPEYGEFRLDKSRHSAKQVETFVYNAAGLERLRQLLAEKQAA